MSRVKLSEYCAKSLLVKKYTGISICLGMLDRATDGMQSSTNYVLKVDQGVKKRGKQGLMQLNVTKDTAEKAIKALADRGYDRFIAEPMMPHEDSEERYLSIERVRDGVRVLYSSKGGVDVEEHSDSIVQYANPDKAPLPKGFVNSLVDVMNREHLCFVEINPLIVRGDTCTLLDAAVLADSAGDWLSTWTDDDIVDAQKKTKAETAITELNDGSPASFSFRVLNPDGAVWLLLSGGGASITIADEAANRGKADLIGNYGEYSGGPTREETQIYTEAVLKQLFLSQAPKKAIVIAGGVANFTDVRKTFAGIIDALSKHIDQLQKEKIKVYVRRGGPNEKEGLALMEVFLKKHDIFGSIHGSDVVLTTVVDEALERVDA